MNRNIKIISSLTAVILLMTTVSFLCPAAGEYGVELIQNGGFENVTNGVPDNWNGFRTWTNGSTISLAQGENCPDDRGQNCIKIDVTAEDDNPFAEQTVTGIKGEYRYVLSFWLKGQTSRGMSVKFAEYDINGKLLKEHYSNGYKAAYYWQKIEYAFYTEADTTTIVVMPRAYRTDTTIYIDNVSLKMMGAPYMFTLDTDRAFYYEEHKETAITLNMNPFYEADNYTVDFKLTKGPKTVAERIDCLFTGHSLTVKMDISNLIKKSEYTITATVKKNGETVEKLNQYISRYDRPKALDKNGVYYVDGKPFEPVFANHFDFESYEDAKKAGINVLQWSAKDGMDAEKTIAELDEIHKNGMMVAVVCYWDMVPAGNPLNIERVGRFINTIKDHPAIFCYLTMDEPYSHNLYADEDLRNSYKMIRNVDDVHPVSLCADRADKYYECGRYVDCLQTDPYPGLMDFSVHVANLTSAAREAVYFEKPVYVLTQSMSWKGFIPDGPMLRTQLYQALMAGGQCIGYYPWLPDAEVDTVLPQSRYWNTMVEFNDKDKPILYAYYGRGEYEQIQRFTGDNVWYEMFTDGVRNYIVVLSRKTIAQSVEIPIDSLPDKFNISVISGGENEDIKIEGDTLEVDLDAYGALLLKLVPPEANEGIAVNHNSEIITAASEGLAAEDRLFLAVYGTKNGVQCLTDIAVASAGRDGYAVCRLNKQDENAVVKAFVLNEKLNVTRKY